MATYVKRNTLCLHLFDRIYDEKEIKIVSFFFTYVVYCVIGWQTKTHKSKFLLQYDFGFISLWINFWLFTLQKFNWTLCIIRRHCLTKITIKDNVTSNEPCEVPTISTIKTSEYNTPTHILHVFCFQSEKYLYKIIIYHFMRPEKPSTIFLNCALLSWKKIK